MKLTKKSTTIDVAQIIEKHTNIALFAHTNPDGDAIGATVALALGLTKIGKNVSLFCDTPMNDKLSCFNRVNSFSQNFAGKFDLMIAIDCGDLLRLGAFATVYSNFAETITVDHHGGDYFSKYNCVEHIASTCQLIYDVLKNLKVDIDSELATYLYMGLCTDTGNFAHNNTDKEAFLMAADMAGFGADMESVYRVFFRDTTLAETKLIGKVLARMRTFFDNRLILLYVTKEELDSFGLDASATSALVQYAINVDTARVGVCICEHSNDVYKVSMRGKDFNVRAICNQFGGGGHILASGCMINGMLEEVIEKIARAVEIDL